MRYLVSLCALAALCLSPAVRSEEAKKEGSVKYPVVVIETSLGNIEVELYQDKCPITVKNFLDYVKDKHYDGTVFHRIINNFMIQGGGFTAEYKQKPTKVPIKNESSDTGPKNVTYSIAMARTPDLDSATCQFFINVRDNVSLDTDKYCAFGMVISGKDVVDKIKAVPTSHARGTEDRPNEVVLIKSIKVKE